MERLTLTPHAHEIVINNGSLDGAVDLFSYGAESEESQRQLGSLYVIGHRASDSSNMGYIVSLVAALARREYYAQPGQAPRDAFARMLKKTNEVVDEFFKSAAVDLSVGIFAVAGSSIFVSKLDKFKILLARDGQTIDILNNVALFQKEHVEKRRFSSIISGSLQPGDRILAYYPAKPVTTRERHIKASLTSLEYTDFAAKLESIGQQHSSFAAALLHVDMIQSAEPATTDSAPSSPVPDIPPPVQTPATYAWAPRQAVEPSRHERAATLAEASEEVPRIISTEFALGTREYFFSKWLRGLHVIRLDTRGKALFLGIGAVVILAGVLVTKSLLFVDPQAQRINQTIQTAKKDFDAAPTDRQTLMRVLTTLSAGDVANNKDARTLVASIVGAMDTLDNAQTGTLSLANQLDPATDRLVIATWASASSTLWAVSKGSDDALVAGPVVESAVAQRVALGESQPSLITPFKSGALVLDAANKKIIRIADPSTKTFAIPTQDTILSAALYENSLYVLTDQTILKVNDLDTDKPVTKQWLASVSDFAPGATQIFVDGNIYTLGHDGMLTAYYKGKKASQVQAAVGPSGNWSLLPGPQDTELAIANSDTKRIYIITIKDGSLVRTLKVDTQQTVLDMFSGPAGATFLITKDNKIWKVQ